MTLEGCPSSGDGSESYSNAGWEEDASGSNPYGSELFENSADDNAVSTASARSKRGAEEAPLLQVSQSREDGVCSRATTSSSITSTATVVAWQRAVMATDNGKSFGKEDSLSAGRCTAQEDTGFRPNVPPVFEPDEDRVDEDVASNGIISNNEQQAWEASPPEILPTGHLGETKDGGNNNSDHHDPELPCVDSYLLVEAPESPGSRAATVRSFPGSTPPAGDKSLSLSEATQHEEEASNDLALLELLGKRRAAGDVLLASPRPPRETTAKIPGWWPQKTPARSTYRARRDEADRVLGGCFAHPPDGDNSRSSRSSSSSSSALQHKFSVENARAEYSGKLLFDGRWLNMIRRASRHSGTNGTSPEDARCRDASGALGAPGRGKGEDLENSMAKEEVKQRPPFFAEQRYHYKWRDATEEVSTEGGLNNTTERIRRETNDEKRSPASVKSTYRSSNRAWGPSQWDALQPRLTAQVPTYRSQKIVSRSVIGRIQALTALEALKSLPPTTTTTRSADGVQKGRSDLLLQRRRERRRARPRKRQHREQADEISTYASIKAEKIRTRRDHEAWLARVAAGRDEPIQDPLSLIGECLEHRRQGLGRHRDESPHPSTSLDASLSLRLAGGGAKSMRNTDDIDSESTMAGRKAAERRFVLSAPRLEDLVVATRDLLLSEEEERIASEGEEGAERRARIAGNIFFTGRGGHCEDGGRQYDKGKMGDETRRGVGEEEGGCLQCSRSGATAAAAAAAAAGVRAGVRDGRRERRVCSSCLLRSSNSSNNNNSTLGSRGGDGIYRNYETVEEFARRSLAESRLLK